MKVCTVVGTRPEVIRLSRVIPALDAAFDHALIHTGQNYDHELNRIFFEEMGIRLPDYDLCAALHRTQRLNTMMETVSDMLYKLDDAFRNIRPNAVLILGDTNSCLAAAYAAKRLKIPLFHMEAGNRCFDERVPEEVNRRMIDHISDINLPYSTIARENLLREGLPSDRIIKTGSPLFEVLEHYSDQIEVSDILPRLDLRKNDYFLVSCHREENINDNFAKFWALLMELADTYTQRIIVSTHPRAMRRIVVTPPKLVEFRKPFGFFDYVKLQKNARVTLSDSGSITEEAALLGLPALNLREVHERPEGMEEGSVMLTGFNIDRVHSAIKLLSQTVRMDPPNDYCANNVSEKIVRIILSHVDVINRNVWRRNV